MLHSVLVDNLWICYEKGARSSPLGGRWWAQDAAGLLGHMFFWTKFKMADVDSNLTDTSVWGEEGHSTILMAHTRIFTRLISILMCSLYSYIFCCNCGLGAPDGGQSYLSTLITLQKSTKLLFYTLPGAIYIQIGVVDRNWIPFPGMRLTSSQYICHSQ